MFLLYKTSKVSEKLSGYVIYLFLECRAAFLSIFLYPVNFRRFAAVLRSLTFNSFVESSV